jgi:hypothetical protein
MFNLRTMLLAGLAALMPGRIPTANPPPHRHGTAPVGRVRAYSGKVRPAKGLRAIPSGLASGIGVNGIRGRNGGGR